jgi:uncharacterized protein
MPEVPSGTGLEWPATLDVAAARAAGWRPAPFRQFVLKLHRDCNLACAYCYVYQLADQSWRAQPAVMSARTVAAVAARIAEHARAHGLGEVRVVLHGGEPLLAGRDHLAHAVGLLRAAAPDLTVRVSLQTNGVLLDGDWVRLFRSLGVRVGVSLDGPAEAHDRHRRHADGRGSHAKVLRAVRLLARPENRDVFAGLLATIDLANDPIATYQALLDCEPPTLDLLLPHGTWSAPPPGRDPRSAATPYADWLIAIFDRWYSAPTRPVRLRLFEAIIHLLLGGASASEAVGLTPTSLLVIESDGSIEQTDALKAAYHGAPATGLNVARDAFDRALDHPAIVARQLGLAALAADCLACPIRSVCGGGLYPHRYRAGSGFRNPSVYCPDLYRLITHIRDRVETDIRGLTSTS